MNSKNCGMEINQYDIWLADLNPSKGTEPGKTRPVVIIQSDLLNAVHLSSMICPITTNIQPGIELLRVALKPGQLDHPSHILVDQVRAIDNRRLITKLGSLHADQIKKLKQNLKILLDH